MNKKSLGGSTILIVLGLIFIAITGLRTISTPEIWTHLAQGRTNAPISFLASDSVVNTTWLYDKMAYMMYNIGNAPLLIILNIVGLLTAFVLLLQVSKKWGGNISQGFALLFTGHLIFQSLDVGPQVVMMLFLALFLFLLSNVKSPVVLFCALIPLQIIWTNMHGSFLYGPIIAALAAIQATRSSKGSKSNMKQPGMLGILTAALVVSTAANPYFFKMHAQVMASILSPMPVYWSSLFIEYFQIPALKPLIFFLVILGAAGLLTLKKNLPVVLTTLAIFGAFLVWTSPHHAMLFAVFAFPFIVLSLTSVSGYLHGSMSNILGKNDKIILPATGCVLAVLLIVSMIPIITNSAFERTGSASSFGLGVQENLYPADCEAIINHPVFPAAEKTINLAADGGYLAFKYNRKCFIDYRSGRYDREVLTNLTSMMYGNKKALDKLYLDYRPEAFIINTLSPASAQGIVTLLQHQNWKLAYLDGTTAILLQNKDEYAELFNNPEAQQAGLAKLEKARADYAASKKGNPAELIGSGKLFLAFNRPTESKAIFSLLLQGNGTIPGAWIGLGNSQLLLKEFDAAVQSLNTAVHLAPNSELAWRSYAFACQRVGMTEECERAVKKVQQLAERNKAKEPELPPVPEEDEPAEKQEPSLEELTVPSN